MIIETLDETLVKPCIIKSELAIVGVTQDGAKILTESANKVAMDKAIKIAREKILALMLLNRAKYQYGKVRNEAWTLISR